MITIDHNKCNRCGICIQICHEYCIELENGQLKIDYSYCSTCSQCIAICPQQALLWDNFQPIPYNNSQLPSASQLDELFKQRRTIREFKKKKIERELLEEIAGYGSCAPTHNFDMRVIIVDDENIIGNIDKVVLNFNEKMYKFIFKPKLIHLLIKLVAPVYEFEFLKAKPKIENSVTRNKAYKSLPVAIIFVVGDKRIPLSLESAQYILYNMNLYAQTKGIGCRNLVGNQMILNKSKLIQKSLKLNKSEKIFATMGLGYPAKKFSNKVEGKKIRIQWNNEN